MVGRVAEWQAWQSKNKNLTWRWTGHRSKRIIKNHLKHFKYFFLNKNFIETMEIDDLEDYVVVEWREQAINLKRLRSLLKASSRNQPAIVLSPSISRVDLATTVLGQYATIGLSLISFHPPLVWCQQLKHTTFCHLYISFWLFWNFTVLRISC